jgi:hypothetical protein
MLSQNLRFIRNVIEKKSNDKTGALDHPVINNRKFRIPDINEEMSLTLTIKRE